MFKRFIRFIFLIVRRECIWDAIVAERRGDQKVALEKWQVVSEKFPKYYFGVMRCANLMSQWGRFEEAEGLLLQLNLSKPGDSGVLIALVQVAQRARNYDVAVERSAALVEAFPKNNQCRELHIQNLLDVVDLDSAQKFYDEYLTDSIDVNYRLLQSDIYLYQREFAKALDFLRGLQKCFPENISVTKKLMNILIMKYKETGDEKDAERVLSELDKLNYERSRNSQVLRNVIRALIILNKKDEALGLIERLPNKRRQELEFKMWAHYMQGNVEAAKCVWQDLVNRFFVPQIQMPSPGVLKRTDSNQLQITDGSILLFTAVRNERWRLPFFLEYYRSLGVDRFFFIDNGSSDSTAEYLHAQVDVYVYWTEQNFAKSYSAVTWLNGLMEEHGSNNWCLYVDVDELIVFPHSETCGLRELTTYMADNEHEAMQGFMMDMYAPGLESVPRNDDYRNFFEDYPLFDNRYIKTGEIGCPYVYVSGGIRRLFERVEVQTKTPIMRGGRGIKLLSSSHKISPAFLSDVTCVLLHYKLAGDFRSSFEQELVVKSRMAICVRRHWRYLQVLNNLNSEETFKFDTTESYVSSQQLLDLGLIKSTDQFDMQYGDRVDMSDEKP